MTNVRIGDIPLCREFLDRIRVRMREIIPQFAERWAAMTNPEEIASDPLWIAEVGRIMDEITPEFLARARALDRNRRRRTQ